VVVGDIDGDDEERMAEADLLPALEGRLSLVKL
jgi:hypothetical protein